VVLHRWRTVAVTVLVVVLTATAVTVLARTQAAGADPVDEARQAATAFLDTYVGDDGRVERTDQGGDTVSEGQAYGMLVAVAVADEERFRAIWTWAATNLQRDDDLLAWRWADGAVVDASPAADADLIAAGALVLAGRRFADPHLVAEGRAMSTAVLAHETAVIGSRRVLLAGPWALGERVANPSYFVLGMMSLLYDAGETAWQDVAASSRRLLTDATAAAPGLVPDWSTVADDGASMAPRGAPGGGEPQSGYEAGRAYVQLAADCGGGQEIAARAWPFLSAEAADGGTVNAVYALDGTPSTTSSHPLALVAAASSAAAADDPASSAALLDRATELDDASPTYYGAAWVAIARLWLDTDLLGGCRPGANGV
jgi:endo-1,4-beta-D-glucanase Y